MAKTLLVIMLTGLVLASAGLPSVEIETLNRHTAALLAAIE